MLLRPVRIPANVPATKSCDLLIPHMLWPTYLSSFDGWIPSQYLAYPAMFRQMCHILPHSKAVPNAAFIRFLTRVVSQLQTWNLQPKHSNYWKISCHSNDQSVSEGGAMMERHIFRNNTSWNDGTACQQCIADLLIPLQTSFHTILDVF